MTKRKAHIVGVGESAYARWGKIGDVTEHALALQAITRAVADAGLTIDDVDGPTFPDVRVEPAGPGEPRPVRGTVTLAVRAEDPRDVQSLTARFEDPALAETVAFGPDGLAAYIEFDEYDVPTVRVVRLRGLPG